MTTFTFQITAQAVSFCCCTAMVCADERYEKRRSFVTVCKFPSFIFPIWGSGSFGPMRETALQGVCQNFFFLLTLSYPCSDSGLPSAPFSELLGPGSKRLVEIWADINSIADTPGAKYKLRVLKSWDMFHCAS